MACSLRAQSSPLFCRAKRWPPHSNVKSRPQPWTPFLATFWIWIYKVCARFIIVSVFGWFRQINTIELSSLSTFIVRPKKVEVNGGRQHTVQGNKVALLCKVRITCAVSIQFQQQVLWICYGNNSCTAAEYCLPDKSTDEKHFLLHTHLIAAISFECCRSS